MKMLNFLKLITVVGFLIKLKIVKMILQKINKRYFQKSKKNLFQQVKNLEIYLTNIIKFEKKKNTFRYIVRFNSRNDK